MEITRRLFLTAVAAAGSVGPVAMAAEDVTELAPVVKAGEPGWISIRSHGFQRVVYSRKMVLQLSAQRTDGTYFAVQAPLLEEDFTIAKVNSVIENALLMLESFRTCACQVGAACPTHYHPPPTPEEITELEAEGLL